MAHVENRIGEGIEQVIADHDPNDLHSFGAAGHREQQNPCNRQQRCRQQQPRPGLTLFGAGAVNDVAHGYIGDGINDFGDDGENHQKSAAPYAGQLEYIGIVDIEVSSQYGVEQQCPGGPQQIPQPFFLCGDVLGSNPASRQLVRCCFHILFLLFLRQRRYFDFGQEAPCSPENVPVGKGGKALRKAIRERICR